MNINFEYWRELADKMGYTKEQIKYDKEANIKMGYELLKRIISRIQNPTIEKIGTLYHILAKEKISSYGKVLKFYYERWIWINPLPSTIDNILDYLDYIIDNPPSTKGF